MDLLIVILLLLTGVDPAAGAGTTDPTTEDGGETVRKSPIG